jgi:hypothetical protein
LYGMVATFHEMRDHSSSTINQHHLLFREYLKQVKSRSGGQNEHLLMSTVTVWLLR